jgi:hypothetical protein
MYPSIGFHHFRVTGSIWSHCAFHHGYWRRLPVLGHIRTLEVCLWCLGFPCGISLEYESVNLSSWLCIVFLIIQITAMSDMMKRYKKPGLEEPRSLRHQTQKLDEEKPAATMDSDKASLYLLHKIWVTLNLKAQNVVHIRYQICTAATW